MILHDLHLRHWRNIAALDLEGLDEPMVVLHGPNRTGKSSVVLALRYCLFDYDHNSRAAALVNCVPWRSKKSPEVCIGFSHDGRRYRLRKVFSQAKDGDAWLEEITSTGAAVLERGKEADRQVRKLLGLEKSTEGLNELLWLTQGEVRLPATDKLSRPLQQRLESVLGTLLTSHDWKFQEVLGQCWSEFFTPTGRVQKNSPVAVLEDDIAKRRSEVDRLTSESRQGEALLREYESLEDQNRQERVNIAESEREVERLRSAAREVSARRAAHEQARAALASAEKAREEVCAKLDEFGRVRAALVEMEREAAGLEGELQAAAQTQQRATEDSLAAKRQLDALRRERDQWERQRVELDERDRLVRLAEQTERLRKQTEEAAALERRVRECEAELGRLVAPDDATVAALRESAREIHRLEARLEAAAVHVVIEPQAGGRFQVRCDDAEPQTAHAVNFRQRMDLVIDGWGIVRVTRGEQDRTADDIARQLDKLRRDFGDAVRGFGINPADPKALDELVRLQTQREVLLGEKRTQERRLRELAPDGTAALANQAEQATRKRAAVINLFPALAEWDPDLIDLERRKSEFQSASCELQEQLRAAEAERDRRFVAKDAAEEESARLREQSARLDMNRELTARRLTELGDEHSLSQAAQRAETNCCEATEQVRQTALSADEERIEQQLAGAEAALARRRERLTEREKQAERVRGQLLQMHGLHDRLAHAEAELHRLLAEQRRCRVDADAHQLLRDLFEECRERQVRATTGRIESQVVEWSGRLGLSEYQSVEFGGGYLPDGLRLPAVAESVAIEDESYGTLEQFALLVRLAVGQLVAAGQRHVAILDDPLTHADLAKHRRMLEILEDVAGGRVRCDNGTPLAPLQMLIFTCHPERFDHLVQAKQIDLATAIQRDF